MVIREREGRRHRRSRDSLSGHMLACGWSGHSEWIRYVARACTYGELSRVDVMVMELGNKAAATVCRL
jgi:hypothetical protein